MDDLPFNLLYFIIIIKKMARSARSFTMAALTYPVVAAESFACSHQNSKSFSGFFGYLAVQIPGFPPVKSVDLTLNVHSACGGGFPLQDGAVIEYFR
ncbi:hypothetical protein [Geomobilimonas luticola]|uniref:Uncharacterized protein n=1 Tax=Geomobilimonas luticola TaxID=1114878 RepID=A0ABS5SCU1_9BACT|nr:hypothetical protein [Geomobilimonas luticola]MBT0653194.1 hypothetical protein [Geomobilimonas luticola]